MFPIGSLADTDHTTTNQGALWRPRWVSYRLWLLNPTMKEKLLLGFIKMQFHNRVGTVSRQQLDQTGAHIYGLVLGRCSCCSFISNPLSLFSNTSADNVSAASQVSEESNTGRKRNFLARTGATTLLIMATINSLCVW